MGKRQGRNKRRNKIQDHLGLRVSYDGKDFEGFQSQSNARSIQQTIEKALSIFFRKPIRIDFSSRTDSGVHAYDQIVLVRNGFSDYEVLTKEQKKRFLFSLNSLLEKKISAWQILRLKADFHPKRAIQWKEYHYKIFQGLCLDPLLRDQTWWIRSPLSLPKIRKALRCFEGRHDFTAFANQRKNPTGKIDNRRRILEAKVEVERHPFMSEAKILTFRFRGEGFLYRMVRNMVGALLEVGRGKDFQVAEILKTKKRKAFQVAPAHALTLVQSKIKPQFIRNLTRTTRFLFLPILLSCIFQFSNLNAKEMPFSGSMTLTVSQRFFDDEKLGHVNGFSDWGALGFGLSFGLYEFSFGLEPILSFNFIKNSASLYALDDSGRLVLDAGGNPIKSDVDSLEYQFYTGGYGLRYKPYQPDFFWIIPYAEIQQTLTYGRVRKRTFAVDQQKLNTGIDIGMEVAGGILISFMSDSRRHLELKDEWNMKDFALLTSVRYLPSGFWRQGLGLVESTGGWSFGLGLFMDW